MANNRFVTPVEIYTDSSAQRQLETNSHVLATWLENTGPGIGAAVVLVAMWLMWHGAIYRFGWTASPWPVPAVVAVSAAILGTLVFGALMVCRSRIFIQWWEWERAMADLRELEAINGRLADKLRVTTEELRQLRAELLIASREHQASSVQYVAPAAPDTRGIDDARTLLERATRKQDWSREGMKAAGWTQPQWETARDTLIAARLLAYNGKWPKLVVADYEQACQALEAYKARMAQAKMS